MQFPAKLLLCMKQSFTDKCVALVHPLEGLQPESERFGSIEDNWTSEARVLKTDFLGSVICVET